MLNVFKKVENNEEVLTGAKQLDITQRLTDTATIGAEAILKHINSLEGDDGNKLVLATITEPVVLDRLITTEHVADKQDWLVTTDSEVVGKALKSQQSKRSRARSAIKDGDVSIQDYKKYLVGAIAEHLIRNSCEVPKGIRSERTSSIATLELTEEEAVSFKADQFKLAKVIRNVQSKKTAMKKVAGFTEEDAQWVKILAYEESLKVLRTGESSIDPELANKALRADEMAAAMSALGDISKMKKADLEAAIENLKGMALSKI